MWLGYLAGIAAGMVASRPDGRPLRLARARPDRRRDRDHARRRRASRASSSGASSAPYPRLALRRRSSIPLLDRHSGARQEPVRPAADRVPRVPHRSSAVAWVFRSTNIGLNLRAAGEKPEALDAAGVSVVATRSYAALATGALAGLGGAYLAIVGGRDLHAFHHAGPGLHGDRDRHARSRAAAAGRSSSRSCSASALSLSDSLRSPASTSPPTS